ncbi:C39 family peptidase [Allokutzneria sp. A3M-2-11 16]|uniref:C39 family peptidase n=1 Tax=Allokutzneria sp. A3M-2-11 16 TaxID=2962043 RepID=UPI0020B6F2F8|nr:C39 family peptidase [Allokutzneria sp. A3M-2-11 16]MCP3801944.1 C39 family peptidase [Allokutzneria sp. A3M-2-11 16]
MIKRLATLLVVAASTMALFGGVVSAAPVIPASKAEASIGSVNALSSKVLNHTWYGQQTGYWCGPGSAQIAIGTRRTPPSQQTLANFMGTHTGGTDHINRIQRALNYYIGTSWFELKRMYDPPTQAQRNLLVRDLVLNVNNNFPMVANVISGWRPPGYPGGAIYHYVAVVGYRSGGAEALIADPAGAGHGGGGWWNVPRTYWVSTHNLGTWIGGSSGYTA